MKTETVTCDVCSAEVPPNQAPRSWAFEQMSPEFGLRYRFDMCGACYLNLVDGGPKGVLRAWFARVTKRKGAA